MFNRKKECNKSYSANILILSEFQLLDITYTPTYTGSEFVQVGVCDERCRGIAHQIMRVIAWINISHCCCG